MAPFFPRCCHPNLKDADFLLHMLADRSVSINRYEKIPGRLEKKIHKGRKKRKDFSVYFSKLVQISSLFVYSLTKYKLNERKTRAFLLNPQNHFNKLINIDQVIQIYEIIIDQQMKIRYDES